MPKIDDRLDTSIKVDAETWDDIREIAKRENRTIKAVVKLAIVAYGKKSR
jgi:predicted DNA-binding ribbon-helix-helix protein